MVVNTDFRECYALPCGAGPCIFFNELLVSGSHPRVRLRLRVENFTHALLVAEETCVAREEFFSPR